MRLNGGTSQELANYSGGAANNSETVAFSGTTDSQGEALFEYRAASSSSGWSYVNAVRLTPGAPVPVATITLTGDLQPGASFTVNYANFEGVPVSPVTLTDSNSNSITVPVTISDNGDGTGTATGTMPALPASGTAQGLLFGNVTVELST